MGSTVEWGVGPSVLRSTGTRLAGAFPASLSHKVRHAWRLTWHWAHFRNRVRADRVVFPGLVELHVDPADERGQYVRRHRGVTQSGVTGAWFAASDLLEPDVCIDIGANYGEVSLLRRYRDGRRLILVEPNPSILPLLRRSVASHVDSPSITVIPKAIGDAPGWATLAVEEGYSGTSTLRAADRGDTAETGGASGVEVEVTTVDAILADTHLDGASLLFKIDVEGYEKHALAGMTGSLRRCRSFAGIVEYDRAYLDEAAPGNAVATARLLLELGRCWAIDDRSLRPLAGVDDFPDHADVVVTDVGGLDDQLSLPGWMRSR